ncbi:MAG: 30S ribosomal protein S17 [Candidatus Omnitrophica bacterium]|nr:30S ribosomal protein S17 [Candidatus Omnitrophota bacterium]
MKTRGKRKELVGLVVSDKMDKTIVVSVERISKHPLYQKRMRLYRKFKVHDQNNEAKEGQRVRIMETRPLSKDKRWRLVEVIK